MQSEVNVPGVIPPKKKPYEGHLEQGFLVSCPAFLKKGWKITDLCHNYVKEKAVIYFNSLSLEKFGNAFEAVCT